jgi:hypothetical protein
MSLILEVAPAGMADAAKAANITPRRASRRKAERGLLVVLGRCIFGPMSRRLSPLSRG